MTKFQVIVLCFAFITLVYVNAAPVEEENNEEHEYPDFAYTCAKKFNISNDQIEDYYLPETKAEEYENDHDMKCFIHCTLEALKMMKDDKILFAETKARYEKKDSVMALLFEKYYGKCVKVKPNLKDSCEIAYQLEVCSDEEHSTFNEGFQSALIEQ